ncbi:MAG: PEP-utilizing enzyme [Alphaproteobacteria bacterium]|nr:PEP-utilizing enzyme [Alphaproteobacteria bacterium]
MAAILSYPEAFAAGASTVGAKAWNLARLARWGYPTPRGIVVDIGAYDAVIALPPIAALVAEAGSIAPCDILDTDADALLARLGRAIEAAPLPESVEAGLEPALASGGLTARPLAVRSSATGEDGDNHAFAGIHDSVLNVVGIDAVLAGIRRCFASLWTPQALAYRRRFAIADADIRCGIVICEMIAAKDASEPIAAGVVFTADPGDGRHHRIVIETVAGLGDRLVGGRQTPARATIDVVNNKILPPQGALSTLPRIIATKLASLAWRIHWDFSESDQPQDIEWAFDGDRLFILQTRPITALPRRTFPAIADQADIWTNANFKEVLGVLSPASLSNAYMAMAERFLDLNRLSGFHAPEGVRFLRCIAGRLYFNASFLQYAWYDTWGTLPAAFNSHFGGFQGEITVPLQTPLCGLAGLRRLFAQFRMFGAIWRLPRTLPATNLRLLSQGRQFRRRDLSPLPDGELARLWLEISQSPQWRVPFMEAGAIAPIWLGLAYMIVAKHFPKDRIAAVIGGLMAGQGGITSAEHGYHLQEIVARCGASGPAFDAALTQWLDSYGHRGFSEQDIANPRWAETPEIIARMARAMAITPAHTKATSQPVREKANLDLRQLPLLQRRILHWLIGRATQGVRLREETKSALVMIVAMARHLALEAGRRMVLRGTIDRQDDVFMLYEPDILAFATGEWQGEGARAKIEDRIAQRAIQLANPPPDVIIEAAHAVTAPAAPPVAPAPDATMSGLAASPGKARGTARKLSHPGDAAPLRDGGILVARSTDPGWTPLFLLADAIVVEIGGYLSHGAIVAREFGIPSVVNIPGAFDRISQGAEIFVDGDAGQVLLLE